MKFVQHEFFVKIFHERTDYCRYYLIEDSCQTPEIQGPFSKSSKEVVNK